MGCLCRGDKSHGTKLSRRRMIEIFCFTFLTIPSWRNCDSSSKSVYLGSLLGKSRPIEHALIKSPKKIIWISKYYLRQRLALVFSEVEFSPSEHRVIIFQDHLTAQDVRVARICASLQTPSTFYRGAEVFSETHISLS